MFFSVLGIIMVLIGTAFSLWTIITRDTKKAGTWEGIYEQSIEAEKEKKCVMWGIALIAVGSIFQIFGAVLS